MGVVCSTSSDLAKMVLGCYRLNLYRVAFFRKGSVSEKNPFLNPARRQVRKGKKRRVRWNGKVMCPNFNDANQGPRGSIRTLLESQTSCYIHQSLHLLGFPCPRSNFSGLVKRFCICLFCAAVLPISASLIFGQVHQIVLSHHDQRSYRCLRPGMDGSSLSACKLNPIP